MFAWQQEQGPFQLPGSGQGQGLRNGPAGDSFGCSEDRGFTGAPKSGPEIKGFSKIAVEAHAFVGVDLGRVRPRQRRFIVH